MTQDSARPWLAERAVSEDLARELIEAQFPELAPVRLELLGVGWDNSAWLAGGEWVFRFPRREIAVALLEAETRLLPALAPALPLAVPVPVHVGRPSQAFDWPFAGYRHLPGRTACRVGLDDGNRLRAAAPLARFLSALHGYPAERARRCGAPPDELGRLHIERRTRQLEGRLGQALAQDLLPDRRAADRVLGELPSGWSPRTDTLVHGDLYARHLLVDETRAPCGVIDWGDVHLGDAAVDLNLARGYLGPAAREAFLEVYGPVDADTWAMAGFKALHHALMLVVYGADTGDADLVREGRTSLAHLAEG